MLSYLFVYGSLRRGQALHGEMERSSADFVATASMRGKLFQLGSYTGLVLDGDDLIGGELYRLPDPRTALRRLDVVEGSEYRRAVARVARDGAAPRLAWVYVLRQVPATGTAQDATARSWILQHTPSVLFAEVLDAVGDPDALVRAALRLSLYVAGAERGLLSFGSDAAASQGYSPQEAADLSRRLREEIASGEAREFAPGGIAATVDCAGEQLLVAVERPEPFCAESRCRLLSLMAQLQKPLELTARVARGRAQKLKLADVFLNGTLDRMDPFPRIVDVERILIQAALRRTRSRGEAARQLGVTREGLRKKMIRLGLRTARRAPAAIRPGMA